MIVGMALVAMRGAMAETLQSLLQPVDKLRHTIERRARATSPVTQSLEYAAANIAATSDALSPPAMQAPDAAHNASAKNRRFIRTAYLT